MGNRGEHPCVVVVGPIGATGGMATAMRLQLSSTLADRYRIVPFDNSKRTAVDRSFLQGCWSQLRLARELMRVVADTRPDVVHIHTCSGLSFYRSIIDVCISKLHGCAVVCHIHGGRFEQFLLSTRALTRWCVRRVLRWSDRVIALSDQWAQRLARFDARIDLYVVPNGVAMPTGRRARAQRHMRLMYVGDLRPAKGVFDLIEAVHLLPKRLKASLSVELVGPSVNGCRADIVEALRAKQLVDQFELPGALPFDAVQTRLLKATLFVLPSHSEAMPISLMEAMACGVPCVATKVGDIPNVLEHDRLGLLVDAGDPRQLSKAIKKLLDAPELRRRYGQAARRHIRNSHSQAVYAQQLDDLYKGIITGHQGVSQ